MINANCSGNFKGSLLRLIGKDLRIVANTDRIWLNGQVEAMPQMRNPRCGLLQLTGVRV